MVEVKKKLNTSTTREKRKEFFLFSAKRFKRRLIAKTFIRCRLTMKKMDLNKYVTFFALPKTMNQIP